LKHGYGITEKLNKMDRLEIDNILKINELNSELEFEQATAIQGKLRWMVEGNPSLEPLRQHLLELIQNYEAKNWGNEVDITDEQIRESDLAEKIVNAESLFIQKRKELIKAKLEENAITQKDLGKILGHRPNYMSELMNGIRPFSKDDIVVIHRLFGIEFNDLIPTFLKREVTNHIKVTLSELNNTKVKLRYKDLETV
jgi:transcriptional regulator with XRE-family HTH domain